VPVLRGPLAVERKCIVSLTPQNLLILDIDGLRQDVFLEAVHGGRIPAIASLLRGGLHLDCTSAAPSITFCSQSSLFTGLPPNRHGIPGNQFFDRFGSRSSGTPRFYAFDIGDTLAVDDAVRIFTGKNGWLGELLPGRQPTLYETASAHGCTSLVAHHMLARGATHWLRPELVDIARLTKGGGLLGMSAPAFDDRMIEEILHALSQGMRPRLITTYFMGLDHHSHQHGPGTQLEYLTGVVDRQVERLLQALDHSACLDNTLVAVISDHGQIEVIPDDRHSLRLSFPFDREMGYLFQSLGLDVHDLPGEDPDCDAVVASNGGLAHVYLQKKDGKWQDRPRFKEDVLPVAHAFWQAGQDGTHAPDLKDALSLVLVRNVEREGWQAAYRAFSPQRLIPLEETLASHPEIQTLDATARLAGLAGPFSGDLLLISNYADGFYFGTPTTGIHGGLHPADSRSVFSLGWTGAEQGDIDRLHSTALEMVKDRSMAEGRRQACVWDVTPLLCRLMGWEE